MLTEQPKRPLVVPLVRYLRRRDIRVRLATADVGTHICKGPFFMKKDNLSHSNDQNFKDLEHGMV